MNHTPDLNPDQSAEDIAADLDTVRDVPTDALMSRLSQDGTCMWIRTTGTEPAWTGNDTVDRGLAAPICARCPVQRECIELEFRAFGYPTSGGVWGPLDEQDRRVVYAAWLTRRDGEAR